MKVVSFIEPPQAHVIEKILRHCGLWNPPTRPPPGDCPDFHGVPAQQGRENGTVPFADPGQPRELTCVDMDTFWATF